MTPSLTRCGTTPRLTSTTLPRSLASRPLLRRPPCAPSATRTSRPSGTPRDRSFGTTTCGDSGRSRWIRSPASRPSTVGSSTPRRRGPVWVNINWLVVRGLEELGLAAEAAVLAEETLDLVRRAGCFEYFHANTGEGLGGADFSWTAALVLDLLRRPIHQPSSGGR